MKVATEMYTEARHVFVHLHLLSIDIYKREPQMKTMV